MITPIRPYRKSAPRPLLFVFLLLFVLPGASPLASQTVAVAANAQALLEDLTKAFRARAGGAELRTVVASSGVLTAQIRNGAPFDLFLSADTSYPMRLWREGKAERPRVYAFGRLILWTKTGARLERGLRALLDPGVRAVAIANPRNAPFGAAALEALRASGLLDSVEAKLVYGESVAQVNQYVDTRAAQVGITASSAPFAAAARPGTWAAVDTALYAPIPQAAAVVVHRADPDGERKARVFLEFLFTPEARGIFQRYGYALP